MTNSNIEQSELPTIIYIFKTECNTCIVINFEPSTNKALNNFLATFDIGKSKSEDLPTKNRFECSNEFYAFAKTETFKHAIKKFNAVTYFGNFENEE